jgi:asparagine N-glycosylation enzyme membrane subunit Stt3
LGLLSAAVFGTLALITSRGDIVMGPRGRIGLGVLAVISVLVLAFVAGGAVAGALVILIVPVVLYLLSRRGRRKTPDGQ